MPVRRPAVFIKWSSRIENIWKLIKEQTAEIKGEV